MSTRTAVVILPLCLLLAVQCKRSPEGGDIPSQHPVAAEPPSSAKGAERLSAQTADFRDAFTAVARHTVPSVVSILSEKQVAAPALPFDFFGELQPFDFFFGPGRRGQEPAPPKRQHRESGLGSGFIASAEGYVLTNNHVVEGAEKLEIQLADERQFEAEVVGADAETDIAVVKIVGDAPDTLEPLELGDSDELEIGEWVVAVGSPFGLYETVTTGIISAKGRQNTGISAYGNFLQTDAAINPGNSGGPLVNLEGEVVGINTAIYSRTGGYQGVGFAIPVNLAKSIMNRLIEEGKVTRGWIGVSIQDISPALQEAMGLDARKGALVSDVLPGGPAAKAGMKRGDVIASIAGQEVQSAQELMNRVALLVPGSTVDVGVLRGGKETTLSVKVAERERELGRATGQPGGAAISALGFGVEDLSADSRQRYGIDEDLKQGVVVTQVAPHGPAAKANLRPGDVILEANQEPIASAAELDAIVEKAPDQRGVVLLVARDGNTFFVVVKP